MMNRVFSATFFLLLTFTMLAGCTGDRGEPAATSTSTSSTSAGPAPLTAVPLAMPTGLQASYSYGPQYAGLRPVNFTITANGGTDFTHGYRYQDCTLCDGEVRYRMAADGTWAHAEFACDLPVPDLRAEPDCLEYVGGWGDHDGLRGPFFGTALIAGLPIAADGTVSRVVTFGTVNVNARFATEVLGADRLQVFAMPESKNYPFRIFPEPVDCNIFTGRVTINTTLALPVECMIDETNTDGSTESFGWSATWTNAKPDAARFTAAGLPVGVTALRVDGARFPPREGDDKTPFGLYEALDYAALTNATVKAFLERPDVMLGNSQMFPTGGIRACPVEPCIRQDNYLWKISLRSGPDDLRLEVNKQVTSPGIAIFNVDAVYWNPPDIPFATFPAKAPYPLSWYWDKAKELRGITPVDIGYYATERGDPLNLEPFVGVGFRAPGTHGIVPMIYFRNDGTVYMFTANGAIEPES